MIELIILIVLAIFALSYRQNNGENVYRFFVTQTKNIYDKYAPYSFKSVSAKVKELGQDYSVKDYVFQVILFAVVAGGITYLYFYSLVIALIYAVIAVLFVPYLSYLRSQKIYSEFIFEQIQIYTTNVIMEFNTTQSFVKSLEGVRDSGILEDPVLSDVREMIDMSYQNGTIDESIIYFNHKYPFYMVKNMNQLFLQITKEGARDSGQALENMSMDIDALVEGLYRDQIDRKEFHTRFLTFGMALFLLVMVMQFLLGTDNYMELLNTWYVDFILHAIIIINCGFLIYGEKFYYEDVGVE
jgi:hypothetical protein